MEVLRDINIKEYEQLNKIEHRNDGIYVLNSNGEWQRGYVYIKYSHISSVGTSLENIDSRLPRFHLYECDGGGTFNGVFNERFAFSNYRNVTIVDKDIPNLKFFNKNLILCKSCTDKYKKNTNEKIDFNTTDEFFEKLEIKDDNYDESKTTDIFGYTNDWLAFSDNFRKTNRHCNTCSTSFNKDDFNLLRIKHKNGNRSDNNLSNLEPICLFCYIIENGIDYHYKHLFSQNNIQFYKTNNFLDKNKVVCDTNDLLKLVHPIIARTDMYGKTVKTSNYYSKRLSIKHNVSFDFFNQFSFEPKFNILEKLIIDLRKRVDFI